MARSPATDRPDRRLHHSRDRPHGQQDRTDGIGRGDPAEVEFARKRQKRPEQQELAARHDRGREAVTRGGEVHPAHRREQRHEPLLQGMHVGHGARPHEQGRHRRQCQDARQRCHDELPHAVLRPLRPEHRHGRAHRECHDAQPSRGECGRLGEPASCPPCRLGGQSQRRRAGPCRRRHRRRAPHEKGSEAGGGRGHERGNARDQREIDSGGHASEPTLLRPRWGRDEWEACGGRGARRGHRGPILPKAPEISGSIAPRRRAPRKHPTHAAHENCHCGSHRGARRLCHRIASDRDVYLLRRRQPHRPAESGSADRGLSWHPAAERSDPRPPEGDTPAAGAAGRRRARHAGRWRHHPFHADAHDAAAGRHRNGSHTTAGAGPAGGELIRHPADPHDAESPPRAAAYFFSAGGSPASFLSFASRSTASDRVANIGSLASTSSRILRARSFSPRSVRIVAT